MSLPRLSLNNKQLFWQLILIINQWGVLIVTSFILGLNLGKTLWSELLFLLGIFFQLTIGLLINQKALAVLDIIKKEKAELCLEEKRISDIHIELDELRDRLIFEQDDEYWEILQEL
jgi:hypothetical protein